MSFLKNISKKSFEKLLEKIILWVITSVAFPALAVFIASAFYRGFQIQYLIIAISVFLLNAVFSCFLIFRYRSEKLGESYTYDDTCYEVIVKPDGATIYNMHLEILPNYKIKDGPTVKGLFNRGLFKDFSDWSEPIITHDNKLGSCRDIGNPHRYLIWLVDEPIPNKTYKCSITGEYTNTNNKPTYNSWLVKRKRQSITLFVAIHKNFQIKDVKFTIAPKGEGGTFAPLKPDENNEHSIYNREVQINCTDYNIYKQKVQNPQSGVKYSIEWKWV